MKVVRAQVVTPSDSGLPSDSIVNTFHWRSEAAVAITTAALDQITDALQTFWNGFEGRIPATLVNSPSTVKYYDMEDPEPRIPVYTDSFGWTPGVGLTALPSEVCACISWTAPVESGVNPQSRRGRTFMGPLATNAIDVASGRVKFTTTAVSDWVTKADELATVSTVLEGYRLAVYSPTLHQTYSLEFSTSVVNGGWIDNAPDTQRRRGTDPTSRTTFAG